MKPAQLRRWIRQYGNWGVLAVGIYLGLRSLWTRQRVTLVALLLVPCLGICFFGLHPHRVHRSVPSTSPLVPSAPIPMASVPEALPSSDMDTPQTPEPITDHRPTVP